MPTTTVRCRLIRLNQSRMPLHTAAQIYARPAKLAGHPHQIFPRTRLSGFTLVEVMLAAAIAVVAALGILCCQYLAIHDARIAQAQLTATRIGQLLVEDWKSTGGADDYNPEDLQLGFTMTSALPAGHCVTTVDSLPLYIRMFCDDVADDDFAGVTLRQINVIVRWQKNFGRDGIKDDDPGVSLTTYVRRDQD